MLINAVVGDGRPLVGCVVVGSYCEWSAGSISCRSVF